MSKLRHDVTPFGAGIACDFVTKLSAHFLRAQLRSCAPVAPFCMHFRRSDHTPRDDPGGRHALRILPFVPRSDAVKPENPCGERPWLTHRKTSNSSTLSCVVRSRPSK